MENLLAFLQSFGIQVDENTPYFILMAYYYLVLSLFILVNVINISIYLLSIYIVSHERFLSMIPERYNYIHRMLNFYKNIRIGYIIFEVILLLSALIIMIALSYGIVSFYIENR